jgi:acetyltransferase-like isoleucine patch superfamily enzyme
MNDQDSVYRVIKAIHGLKNVHNDPDFKTELSKYLLDQYTQKELLDVYTRFAHGNDVINVLMRCAIWRAIARKFGNGVTIDESVGFKHLETFEIGDGVFIGAHSYIQGRYDGKCIIGDHVWIGPQSYFDARNLIIENYVGWGPGAKVLGSEHTGIPIEFPIIQSDLIIKPVRIEEWADIGVNSIIMPGVTIGKGSIVGAGAVVTQDVKPFSIVAGVPAHFLRWREGYNDDLLKRIQEYEQKITTQPNESRSSETEE